MGESGNAALTLDEDGLVALPVAKRSIFIYGWLKELEGQLLVETAAKVKQCQKELVSQLMMLVRNQPHQGSGTGNSGANSHAILLSFQPGPPIRHLLANCLANVFAIGDTFLLFEVVNECNDILKNRDDSPSYLCTRLSAMKVVGTMYQRLGRITGRSYEETTASLTKGLKNAESQARTETMYTFANICSGLGSASSNVHRDIYKSAKNALSDRSMAVREAAATCLQALADVAPFMYTSTSIGGSSGGDLENLLQVCFRSLDGTNSEARKAIAKLIGLLVAYSQKPPCSFSMMATAASKRASKKTVVSTTSQGRQQPQLMPLEDVLNLLLVGFTRGGSSGSGLMLSKSGSMASQDVRTGISHAYVFLAHILGAKWLEKNLTVFLNHLLVDVLSHPKSVTSHLEAIYSRRCIVHVLRLTLGKLLAERAQLIACKELIAVVAKYCPGTKNSLVFRQEDATATTNSSSQQNANEFQHTIVAALLSLGQLVACLGSSVGNELLDSGPAATARPGFKAGGILEVVFSALQHPSHAPKVAAAWVLRCLCVAAPSNLTLTLDECLNGLEGLKDNVDAISGYSCAIAALLGAVRNTPLGIPHTRGKIVFNLGEELLRSASQNSRLSRERTKAGWLIIGGTFTLGSSVVKGLLPRMMLLWRGAFPKSLKDLESERVRGDSFTWKVTLEARAGALSSMLSFLKHCPDLLTDEVVRRLSLPIESVLTLLTNADVIMKGYQSELKALQATLRFRLFQTLSLLPSTVLEGSYAQLLRLLVSEFTLADGQTTSTSLLRKLCHADDAVLTVCPTLGSLQFHNVSQQIGTASGPQPFLSGLKSLLMSGIQCIPNDDENVLEEQLLSFPNCSGAVEHDDSYLYAAGNESRWFPDPLPLGVAVVDSSLVLFGLVFPKVAHKHRLQILDHFSQHLRRLQSAAAGNSSSSNSNQSAVALHGNIVAALLAGVRGLVHAKVSLTGQEDVKKALTSIIFGCLGSSLQAVRCAAAECLGRLAQVVSEPQFVASVLQLLFDNLKSARDAVSRTGHSFALGCLHRHAGGMGAPSVQHRHTSVSILLALARDVASPVVQKWSLHALTSIAETGGPMFRDFVEPTLSAVVTLLLESNSLEVMVGLGRLLSAMITTMGPELQCDTSSVATIRATFLCACSVLENHLHPVVRAEAFSGLQQLHMFAPSCVNMRATVPRLCTLLNSEHLVLRRAAVACFRQFTQKNASNVCLFALEMEKRTESAVTAGTPVLGTMSSSSTAKNSGDGFMSAKLNFSAGAPGLLFSMLDNETDASVISNVHDTLTSILQAVATTNLKSWLMLCREVLSIGADESSGDDLKVTAPSSALSASNDFEDDPSDDAELAIPGEGSHPRGRAFMLPRWSTKVFAAKCLRKIIEECCQGNRAHYDMELAREIQKVQPQDFLVLHLSELVRVAFMAATSDSDPLRLEGLKILQTVIEVFGRTPDPDFPDHVILEQYQAQVGAALRPAFSPDTPSHVTSWACDVCSAWISSGVARDLDDLRRVYQLLVTSLSKINNTQFEAVAPDPSNRVQVLFNESAVTLEKLSILKAWAEVYAASMKDKVGVVAQVRKGRHQEDGQASGEGDDDDEDFGDFESGGSGGLPSGRSRQGSQGGMDDGKGKSNASSLANLVQAELSCLSKYWMAALKDHALLTLPAEFKAQLPFDGGAFYTNDTIDSARPHFRATWAPILEAAAIWLSYDDEGSDEDSSQQSPQIAKTTTEVRRQGTDDNHAFRCYLLLGVCVEALSNTRSAGDLTSDQVCHCLRSLKALLDNRRCCEVLLAERQGRLKLLVELCNVLHRTVLTRDDSSVQTLAMEVLDLVIACSLKRLDLEKKRRMADLGIPANKTSADISPEVSADLQQLGEGGESGEIDSSASVVFAALEICFCVLVRHHPELSPRATNLPSALSLKACGATAAASSAAKTTWGAAARAHQPQPIHQLVAKRCFSKDVTALIALAVKMVGRLPELCSSMGTKTIMPSILWILSGIIRNTSSSVGAVDEVDGAAAQQPVQPHSATLIAPQVSVALHALKNVLALSATNHHQVNDPESSESWMELHQCTLLRILQGEAVGSQDAGGEDDVGVDKRFGALLAAAIFVLHGPPEAILSSEALRGKVIGTFVDAFRSAGSIHSGGNDSGDPPIKSAFHHAMIRRHCVQSATTIFQAADCRLAAGFAQSLAPPFIQFLLVRCRSKVKTDEDLALVMDCINAVLVLATTPNIGGHNSAGQEERTQEDFLLFLIPALIGLTTAQDQVREATPIQMLLHEKALEKLTEIGQRWPQYFKRVLGQNEAFRKRLEVAALAAAQQGGQCVPDSATAAAGRRPASLLQQPQLQPSIKLSMDFSNYASN